MLKKLWCGIPYRTFSKSSLLKNVERPKTAQPGVETNDGILDATMTFAPNNFEKTVLRLSGRYKKAEIPARVRIETWNNAKSKLRIKLANILMAMTVLVCACTVYFGKKSQSEGRSLLQTITDREEALREEGRHRREQ